MSGHGRGVACRIPLDRDRGAFTLEAWGDLNDDALEAHGLRLSHLAKPDYADRQARVTLTLAPFPAQIWRTADGVGGLKAADFNGDGYTDLALLERETGRPNPPYFYWLFDPEADQFVRSSALERLGDVFLNPATGLLETYWRMGASEEGVSHHRWVNGTLTIAFQAVCPMFHEPGEGALLLTGADGVEQEIPMAPGESCLERMENEEKAFQARWAARTSPPAAQPPPP
ncbi:hypothetical protein MAIT1_03936 [Magnetofaba australis IT-1]|uniref:VCBS repeat-containing protein n=1 Tax=Magnetofaba australis IT-1 TaxID=1434232 RepID=A0A1Y2K8T1_9PROT|nr:hypothetical protein MAIT1_03936 [Magnetofaba australis IT-1]